ncbi:MAG: hypothetical protein P4L31_05070, partial [Candidatus Babeliales bacterium]|nr:hypothetical protein [Candidatus Babeliales bacterium]
MNKVLLLIFLFPFTVYSSCNDVTRKPQKHVIGVHPGAGFFSAFLGALNQLDWCQRTKKTPVVYWDDRSLYYDSKGFNGSRNVWEYYFKPVSHLK